MNKYNELIENYLLGRMSTVEQAQFEARLEKEPELKEALTLQQQIMKGIERAGIRSELARGFKKGSFKNKAGKWVIGLAITALAVSTVLVVKNKLFNNNENIRYELNEENNKNWSDADRYLSPQIFKLSGNRDTVIETQGGIVLQIPARAFLNATGDDVTGEFELEVKEASTPLDIMRAGLSTMSNGRLLETGGMFYINGREDGKNLTIPANKNIYANIPDHTGGKKMMFFDGKREPDGQINWVNPKPLPGNLVPIDIMKLNFYPPHFLDSLKSMGFDISDKRITDSIYYSFVCEGEHHFDYEPTSLAKPVSVLSKEQKIEMEKRAQETMDSLNRVLAEAIGDTPLNGSNKPDAEKIFRQSCSVCHSLGSQKITGPGLQGVIDRVPGGDWLKRYILNNEKMIKDGDPYANKIYQENGKSVMTVFEGQLSDAEVSALIEYIGGTGIQPVFDHGSSPCEIAPSRIHAIWDKKFNNTLLATKEFEARLKEIFKTCNASLLELYIKNMDKKMYEIDSLAMIMTGNSQVFRDFYNKRNGGISINSDNLKKLNAYMEEKREIYEKTAFETLRQLYKNENIENENALEEWNAHNDNETKRINQVFKEELEINMKEAYRQLGKPYKTPIPSPSYFETTIQSTGWKNVDAYVLVSTSKRETLDYKDPESGKKAVIRYEPFVINVEDYTAYDRVIAYLIPDKLSSFQKMQTADQSGFKETLNELFSYSAIVLGFKGDKIYWKNISQAKPGKLSVSLKKMSEKEIKQLSELNAVAARDLAGELKYQVFEQKNVLRRKKIEKRDEIRRRLMPVVFPCSISEGGFTVNY